MMRVEGYCGPHGITYTAFGEHNGSVGFPVFSHMPGEAVAVVVAAILFVVIAFLTAVKIAEHRGGAWWLLPVAAFAGGAALATAIIGEMS